MNAFDILGDPVRRRLLELLATGEVAAGQMAATVVEEFGISQPAVSKHLRVLRDSGFVAARRDGARRLYAVRPEAFDEITDWLQRYTGFWTGRLDALDTEVARGRRRTRSGKEQA